MPSYHHAYIDGRWVELPRTRTTPLVDPATEEVTGEVVLAGMKEVAAAVAAARRAFGAFGSSSRDERLALLRRVLVEYRRRYVDVAVAITADIGAPVWFAEQAQAAAGLAQLDAGISALESYDFAERLERTIVEKVPIGVCALITPWNWPINQIACKVVPALAAGCTVVLKPSELAPRSALVWTQIMETAGVPAGVFNLLPGDGQTGAALAAHDDVDMVSFTGSTCAGIEVARTAASGIKRVCQELGGKSANIILDDAELGVAVPEGIRAACLNSGQSCNAPTRMLVPNARLADAVTLARAAADIEVGPPQANAMLGPVASRAQWLRIQQYIDVGLGEGATLVAGGPGRPGGLDRGFYVKPTVFADVTNDMRIAREEIFGPVVVIIGYDREDDAVRIANDSAYGLAAYVQGSDSARAWRVARRLRAGQVMVNGAMPDFAAPFGGFRRSGNGREWGRHGFSDYLELRAVTGCSLETR